MSIDRRERLAADFRDMLTIQDRPYLSWIATKGELPYAQEYLLTVRVRSYALRSNKGVYTVGVIRRCTIRVTLWDSYPYVAPHIRMLDLPPVFHPDWYSKGDYCSSEPWRPNSSLKDYLMRMIGTLMYDPMLMNTESPANPKALEWFTAHREDGWFPSDTTILSENAPQDAARLEHALCTFDEIIDAIDK